MSKVSIIVITLLKLHKKQTRKEKIAEKFVGNVKDVNLIRLKIDKVNIDIFIAHIRV